MSYYLFFRQISFQNVHNVVSTEP